MTPDDDVPPPPAPAQPGPEDPDALGFVGVLIDHADGSLFLSDIYATRDEARAWSAALPQDRLLGIAAVVLLEGAIKNPRLT